MEKPEVPPRYSNLSPGHSPPPSPSPTDDPKFTDPPLRADSHAPYLVNSRWQLVKAETAIPDEDDFNANPGVLHPNDFEKTKKYQSGTVVHIKEAGSRKLRVDDPPLHSGHALYTVYVLERNVPCYLPTGEVLELEDSQIKESRTSKSSLKRRAFISVDIPDGGPLKNTPIVICQAGLSLARSSKFFGKFTYKVRVLALGVRDMRYVIDRDLVHEELQPVELPVTPNQQLPSAINDSYGVLKPGAGIVTKLLHVIGLRRIWFAFCGIIMPRTKIFVI